MDNGTAILEIECREPEGTVVRTVRPARLSFKVLRNYWLRLREFNVLFNDFIEGDMNSFIRLFVDQGPDGKVCSTGLIWEVDDVGILYLTDIAPQHEARAHFTFWDRRLKGRENLIRAVILQVFQRFGFHRITIEIPLYSDKWLFKVVESLGFVKEGRKREAARYKDQWFDVNIYSILEHEVVYDGDANQKSST